MNTKGCLSAVGLVLTLLLSSLPAGAQAGKAVCTDNANHSVTTCRIDQPVVDQRAKNGFAYSNVVLRPGDLVTVTAGGCVQTGGSGKTWKRYVNPSGPNSNRLYYGTITVPGATPRGFPVHIQTNHQYSVPAGVASPNNVLVLGYVDDDYSDNGYYRHDDGTGDQCKQGPGRDGGPAWVSLVIAHNAPPPPTQGRPFDLTADAVDANGVPLNPRWQYEIDKSKLPEPQGSPYAEENHPDATALCGGFPYLNGSSSNVSFGTPPCTSQGVSLDVPDSGLFTFNDLLCDHKAASGKLHGHVNWWPATMTGTIVWEGHDPAGIDPLTLTTGDDDYNFAFYPDNVSMLTDHHDDHDNYIETEFDSDETIDHFGSKWWNDFHSAVDKGGNIPSDNAAAGAPASLMINNKEAIVTGLIGLDSEHGAYSELHPVYAMAIHLNKDANDDQWAFFARNWGDEGYCSQDQHYWDVSPLSIFIPEPVPSTNFAFLEQDVVSNRSVQIQAGKVPGGIVITFDLGTPESRALVDGSVRIRWTPAPGPTGPVAISRLIHPAIVSANIRAQRIQAGARAAKENEGVKLPALAPEQAQALRQQLQKPAAVKNSVKAQVVSTTLPAAKAPHALAKVVPQRVRRVKDAQKSQKEQRLATAVCAAYKNNVPGLPNACKKVPARAATPRVVHQ